jgi:hypothetical protein
VKRPALFCAWWFCTTTGTRLARATSAELAEANRLWWKHRDLRAGPAGIDAEPCPDSEEGSLDELVADEWTQIGLDSLGEGAA